MAFDLFLGLTCSPLNKSPLVEEGTDENKDIFRNLTLHKSVVFILGFKSDLQILALVLHTCRST